MVIALAIAIITVIVLGLYIYRLKVRQLEIITINEEIVKWNNLTEEELRNKREELDQVHESLIKQKDLITSITKAADEMRQSAAERAQQEYTFKKKEFDRRLDEHYNQASAEIEKQIAAIVSRKEKEALQLKDLQDKQLAYIQAKQRQEEIDSDKDYYRLAINEVDLNDIRLLRELQTRFFKKEAIDKLIWETYYKPAYDILMSHLFQAGVKTCGIYKITDLTTGLAYIGQSVDIKERFRQHIKSSLAYGGATNKLYQTMQKSGQSNFTFEVLEQVPRDKLNEREVYWIDFYKTKEFGMNGTKGGS